jgi:pyruvate dehydrogenase E2 component (dihydrolipoamide acetyltransferase)
MANVIEVKVPDIGDFKNIEVIEIHVKKGDQIKKDDPVISLESDKATMEIPSSASGTVKDIRLKTGDKVSEGTLILTLEAAEATAPAPKPAETKPAATTGKPAPAPTAAAVVKEMEIQVPDIGDFKAVEVIDVLIKVGDVIKLETPLVSLESDKATMDIPSPYAGTIKKILVKSGDKVSKGSPLALIEAVIGGATAPATAPASVATAAPAAPAPAETSRPAARQESMTSVSSRIHESNDYRANGLAHASPAIRKFARELGVHLERVKGSGRKGRILREDITAYTRAVMSGEQSSAGGGGKNMMSMFEIPAVDFSKFGPVETVALTRLNKLSATNLHRSWINVPHVTQFDEADITDMEAYRASKKAEAEKQGTKLTPLSFLIKAVVVALKKHPRFNASLAPNGEELIMKKYFHIGVAVNTEQGLMVPVLKDADKKGMYDLAKELAALAQKARDKKLPPADMQGGCFTISSLGHISGTGFTPIVNAPEVAILGVSKATMKPVFINGKFEPRLILPFSLSYDHRVIDGVAAAEFTKTLSESLSDIRELLL